MAPRAVSPFRACALFFALSPFLFTSASGVASPEDVPKDGELDTHIARLVESTTMFDGVGPNPLPPDLASMMDARLMRLDGSGQLQVYIHAPAATGRAQEASRAAGGNVERVSEERGIVQAAVPVARLRELAGHDGVTFIGLPSYPVLNAVTEGGVELRVDKLREAYGVDGTGIKVGVISDGIFGYDKSQQSRDLPAEINYATCNKVPEFDPAGPLAGGEGTAMLEIVHDLAPGAKLWFGSFGFNSPTAGTEQDFIKAVECLAEHVDVVVDDISFFGAGPYDGRSTVSANTSAQLNDDSNPLRLYTTSVGNWAQRHWSQTFEPCVATHFQLFEATEQTIDSRDAGQRCSYPIDIAPQRTVQINLQWDDAYAASCNDYNLFLLDHDTRKVLTSSTRSQTCSGNPLKGTAPPVELVAWTNRSDSKGLTVDAVIENKDGAAQPRRFDMYSINGGPGPEYGPWYYTPAGSVGNQSDAGGGVISVGAIDVADANAPVIDPYSSNGPTADDRTKPDIAAFDCVNVTGNGYGRSEFCGTSAAAPHIAGIAALLLECNPNLLAASPGGSAAKEREDLRNPLLFTATDLGAPGPDNIYGAGLVDPLVAAEAICLISTELLGDVNCDSGVDTRDSLFILRSVAGIEPKAPCIILGDIDCDSDIDAVDSLRVLRHVAGFPLDIPPGCRAVGT